MICHCLEITREMLHDAVVGLDLRNLHELRQVTGAGDGCTACHRQLRIFLEQHGRADAAQPSAAPA